MAVDSGKAMAPSTTDNQETISHADINSLNKDPERRGPQQVMSLWNYLQAEVDPKQSTVPLAMYCFMTGYVDVVSFSAIFVWCGFQTGNFAQLALAIARLFEGPPGFRDTTFHKADQQALCSLIAFNAGAFLGRIGDRIGAQKRIWLVAVRPAEHCEREGATSMDEPTHVRWHCVHEC
ncbi:hypothetical protein NLJ89_g11359 [Agrocybe chaxingu]|uniref:Uncharacterized protein n=1 Tax=Agrocybe chaxingu TaxID=84603 RepID=A0A9W8JSJ3_9AGAR|nr:hypothetical protein NLJ89_g11359 [Agrocybe chaxingu]